MKLLFLYLMLVTQTGTTQPLGSANVEQLEGVYVYSFSKPQGAYDYLGTVKGGNNGFNEPSGMITKLIREAKKKYPGVQAVIVAPDNNKADAIKFK